MTDSAHSEDRTLPAGGAERLLARAAELDLARGDGASVAELRAAATEAGISARGFDAALAELHGPERAPPPARGRPPWRPRLWATGLGLAGLVAAGALASTREGPSPGAPSRAPAPTAAPTADATVDEAFLLRCITPGDAAELIQPLVVDNSSRVVIRPALAPHVLTVRATPARLKQVREALARYDGAGAPACAPGPTGAPPGRPR